MLLVDAKDDVAAVFYRHHEFIALPDASLMLYLPFASVPKCTKYLAGVGLLSSLASGGALTLLGGSFAVRSAFQKARTLLCLQPIFVMCNTISIL